MEKSHSGWPRTGRFPTFWYWQVANRALLRLLSTYNLVSYRLPMNETTRLSKYCTIGFYHWTHSDFLKHILLHVVYAPSVTFSRVCPVRDMTFNDSTISLSHCPRQAFCGQLDCDFSILGRFRNRARYFRTRVPNLRKRAIHFTQSFYTHEKRL